MDGTRRVPTTFVNAKTLRGSDRPEKDAWGKTGGRVMTTALSCLTLEIYYRYLPLFKAEAGDGGAAPAAAPAKGDDKAKKPAA